MPGRPHLIGSFRRRAATTVALALPVAVLLGGCGDTVRVPPPRVAAENQAACRALVAALPDELTGHSRRDTSDRVYSAAWGDPPIVLRCGVGVPAEYDKFAACQVIHGIGWFVPDATFADQRADAVMTTVDRDPRVEVTVPASLRPPVDVLVDLAPLIKRHTTVTNRCH